MKRFTTLLLGAAVIGVVMGLPSEVVAKLIRVPTVDFPTIQAAVDAGTTQNGDTIRVDPGQYAGAYIYKQLTILGTYSDATKTEITDGPKVYDSTTTPCGVVPELRAGFLLADDGSADGTTISGFTFDCGPVGGADLAFAVFSRGADNVTVLGNVILDPVQGITNWDGSEWTIMSNWIFEIRALCGGGIGILVGSRKGDSAYSNQISYNCIAGSPQIEDVIAPYTTPGILLMCGRKYDPLGGPVTGNTISWNYCSIAGTSGVGIQLIDSSNGGYVSSNDVGLNLLTNCALGIGLDRADENDVYYNSIWFSAADAIGDGIWAGSSSGTGSSDWNEFSDNLVLNSGVNGIFMDVYTSNNQISGGRVWGSGTCDLKDCGTGNSWTNITFQIPMCYCSGKWRLKPRGEGRAEAVVAASPY